MTGSVLLAVHIYIYGLLKVIGQHCCASECCHTMHILRLFMSRLMFAAQVVVATHTLVSLLRFVAVAALC